MVELQLPPGVRGPGPWDSVGDCIITRHWDDGRLTVDQADPRVIVSVEFLEEVRRGKGAPEITIRDDVMRIEASNRTVIYRIGEKVPDMYAYYAEWPD
jgi:hypothetical protein